MNPLTVVGGCYFETCEAPAWHALFGSGGRAAMALANFGPIQLNTYFPAGRHSDLRVFTNRGIEIEATDSPAPIAFAYFHPLSDPVMEPPRSAVAQNPPLHVSGDTVLRFGMIEGDAIVTAARAVFDPQSVGDFAPFAANGSQANELAIVLNQQELCAAARLDEPDAAAAQLLASEAATIIIAKRGIHGATAYQLNKPPVHLPAYRSDRVFKIGTGDVFSAAFAHYWGRLRVDPIDAADLASRSVAHYSASAELPLPRQEELVAMLPVVVGGSATLYGSSDTLAGRWLFEEAAWRLAQLGVEVSTHQGRPRSGSPPQIAGLVLADTLGSALDEYLSHLQEPARYVVFSENDATLAQARRLGMRHTADFATALYWSSWKA